MGLAELGDPQRPGARPMLRLVHEGLTIIRLLACMSQALEG